MSTEKDIIMKEFSKLSHNIVNLEKVEEYVDFCLLKRIPEKLLKKTTSHHILPAATTLPFKQWSNLDKYNWNRAELFYSDHYKAHYLLMNSVDHIATYHAFAAMHKKDFVMGRLEEIDLVDTKEFDMIWTKRNEKVSQRRLEIIDVNGIKMTRASFYMKNRILSKDSIRNMSERVSGDKNPFKRQEVVNKMRNKKLSTFLGDKNMDTISAERAAETMKKEYQNEDGIYTTIYKENGKKLSDTLSKIEENGKTKAQNRNAKIHKILREKGKWYRVLNIFDETYEKILPAAEVRAISPGLEGCYKEKYLGKSKFGENILKKKGKSELIGLFVEKIDQF